MEQSQNIYKASKEWWSRPDDERFLSLEELAAATKARAERSAPEPLRANRIEVTGGMNGGRVLTVDTPGHEAGELTHWSFGQLCSRARVPARFARETHPAIAADAVNYGLRFVAPVDESLLLWEETEGSEPAVMRAMTSQTYGRIYDHSVVEAVQRVVDGGAWKVPAASYSAANPRRATTLYASDRDVFVFLVDEEHQIEVAQPGGGPPARLSRGFIAWNSEVGKTSFGVMTFLYNFVCDNRIIWGATEVNEMTIRHTAGAPDRFEAEGKKMLAAYAGASAAEESRRIRRAMEMDLGTDDAAVSEWLKRRNFTGTESAKILAKAREEEGDARTLWQVVQGGTALARGIAHTDDRLATEKKVSRLLDVAA